MTELPYRLHHHHHHLGFVHPLHDVALHQCLLSSSVCCFPKPHTVFRVGKSTFVNLTWPITLHAFFLHFGRYVHLAWGSVRQKSIQTYSQTKQHTKDRLKEEKPLTISPFANSSLVTDILRSASKRLNKSITL